MLATHLTYGVWCFLTVVQGSENLSIVTCGIISAYPVDRHVHIPGYEGTYVAAASFKIYALYILSQAKANARSRCGLLIESIWVHQPWMALQAAPVCDSFIDGVPV